MDLALVNFDDPSETRSFAKGRFELYRIGPDNSRAGDL